MTETPDFDQIARNLVDAFDPEAMADWPMANGSITLDIAKHFREIWNARGAADRAKADNVLAEHGISAPMVWLDRAIKALDR